MITLQCQLEFQNKQDKETVLDLMRRFSSAMGYAYKRLLEGEKRKDLKKKLSKLFDINTRYSDDAILLAQSTISSCEDKSWQVLSIALAFCCLEGSCRDLSLLKRVIISRNWTAVANRLVPVLGSRDYGISQIPPVGIGDV